MDLGSNLDLDTRVGSLIGSTVVLVMDFSLICFDWILFNGFDFVG